MEKKVCLLSGTILIKSTIIHLLKPTFMGKKLWALALVGAAAYLFNTKKGAELRRKMGGQINDFAAKAKEAYNNRASAGQQAQSFEG